MRVAKLAARGRRAGAIECASLPLGPLGLWRLPVESFGRSLELVLRASVKLVLENGAVSWETRK